jgi:hypothetical protein
MIAYYTPKWILMKRIMLTIAMLLCQTVYLYAQDKQDEVLLKKIAMSISAFRDRYNTAKRNVTEGFQAEPDEQSASIFQNQYSYTIGNDEDKLIRTANDKYCFHIQMQNAKSSPTYAIERIELASSADTLRRQTLSGAVEIFDLYSVPTASSTLSLETVASAPDTNRITFKSSDAELKLDIRQKHEVTITTNGKARLEHFESITIVHFAEIEDLYLPIMIVSKPSISFKGINSLQQSRQYKVEGKTLKCDAVTKIFQGKDSTELKRTITLVTTHSNESYSLGNFRLSHYGLPEPEGVVWDKPIPSYVWYLSIAGGAAAIMFLCGWLLKRRARAWAAAASTTSTRLPKTKVD